MSDDKTWLLDLYQQHGKKVYRMIGEGRASHRSIASTFDLTYHKARNLLDYVRQYGPPSKLKKPKDTEVEVAVAATKEAPGYDYEYRPTTNEYVFTFPGRSGTLVLSADQVRQMKVDYTNWDGHNQTMEQVAMANGLTTQEFFGVKTALGWRKTSLPLLDEDMTDMPEDDIAERLFALKKRGAEVKAKRKIWNMIEEKAAKYDAFLAGHFRPFESAMENLSRTYTPPPPLATPRGTKGEAWKPWALLYSPTDLHYGKYHWAKYGGGPTFDRERCRDRLMVATQHLVERLPSRPEVVVSCIGSDWFNADNVQGKTTSATHTMDMDGTPEQMWEEGIALCLDAHELIRDVGDELWIVLQRGNHDDMLSGAMFSVLKAWFKNDPKVRFHDGRGPYNYLQYGSSMFQITHGHGEHRAAKLANIMAHERPEMWGRTKYKYCFTGNLHHQATHEEGGVLCFLLPSLTGSDRWSTKSGYMMARPGLMGLCFDREAGYVASIFGHVPDELIPVPDDEFEAIPKRGKK